MPNSSHIKKELWRTDLLTRLQGLRFPSFEIELAGRDREGVRVSWEPQGHTNYMIWFNLYVGEDPKVCTYIDPSRSGSTQGWLSTRLIRNEAALDKLPYTLEQWAVEDLRKKNVHPSYRKAIRELLQHHLPRDYEEVWAAIRRGIVGVRHEELHGDVSGYEESLMRRLKETDASPKEFISPDREAFGEVARWAVEQSGKSSGLTTVFNDKFAKIAARWPSSLLTKKAPDDLMLRWKWYPGWISCDLEVTRGYDKRTGLDLTTVIEVTLTTKESSFEEFLKTVRARVSMPTAIRVVKNLRREAHFEDMRRFYEELTRRLEGTVEHEELHTDTGSYYEESAIASLEDVTVRAEDWYAAEQWAKANFKRLGLFYDKQLTQISFDSTQEYWLEKEGPPEINPELMSLMFTTHMGKTTKDDPYLRRIAFDFRMVMPFEWVAGKGVSMPPATLEELIAKTEPFASFSARLDKEAAAKLPAFSEAYRGVYERIFPVVEHAELHTDTSVYDEAIMRVLRGS